jgi:pimeloyl-ACP methyl ester carboxylesterase
MGPRQLLEAFLTPPKVRELSREESLLARSKMSSVRLEGSGFARGGGDEIWIYRWGQGPPVLLVHGWGSRAAHFETLIVALEERGFQAVGFDAPGHGRSGGTLCSAPAVAAAIREVAAQEGSFKAVVAHSLGAVATALELDRSLQAGRTVLLASCCWVEPLAVAFARDHNASEEMVKEMLSFAHAEFRPEEASAEVSAPALGHIPSLLIHDPNDPEMPYQHSIALAAAWPGAALVDILGVGHRRILRARDVVARTMQHIMGCGSPSNDA